MKTAFEVIVVGGGHAGCEAAAAAARMGCSTLLVTTSIGHIALLPCNPAIGGPGKGHVVREIDALGGLMAHATDASTIHLRRVNTGKGPAVQTLRAQTDRDRYSLAIRSLLAELSHLFIYQGEVTEIITGSTGQVSGVRLLHGPFFSAPTVVIAAGTFLNGVIKLGEVSYPAGRQGEFPAQKLSTSLRTLGLTLSRMNTCTPPRLDRRTIDTSQLDRQESDPEPLCFSFTGIPRVYQEAPILLSRTNERTCDIIRKNFHRSPLLYGLADSSPVRECPSLEDKVYRFPERTSHLVFLEPEGPRSNEVYVQGIFTSLPEEVQSQIVRSVPGLEHAHIVRPGYGIEYDYVPPTQLTPSLECKLVPGLFLAGQINGTSGYEEAAGQGILAGINAALSARKKAALTLRRDESYIGVMIDDLVTRGVVEPYRLRTGKVEYRLLVRHDNADRRLTALAYQVGAVSEERHRFVERKKEMIQNEIRRLDVLTVTPSSALNERLAMCQTSPLQEAEKAGSLLMRPRISYRDLSSCDPARPSLSPAVIEAVEIEIRYRGYIERHSRMLVELQRLENKKIPDGFDYEAVPGISSEARDRLRHIRPATLGQASRVIGVTPSDISVLSIMLKRWQSLTQKTDHEQENLATP
ncbi:MAG TPA: tRNA uridine-5-carboxymethylaminomethyl(34) synthesis enzyme MnmG [Atribacteraceae bacterium]|nr:tRNA uridine-5-carboxymethylaminomethyl(34) synthesis enzyme MnmG [Atribacteraceae bacterium]